MTHAWFEDEPDGWPGVFRPLQHHVPSGSRRLLLDNGDLVVFAACGSPCTYPTDATARLPWCPECRNSPEPIQ